MRTSSTQEIDYPSSDGKPMAETPLHMLVIWTTIQVLMDWYVDNPRVYVWGNLFLYYVEGDTSKNVSPDVMVIKGVDKTKHRDVFKTWEEKRKPSLIVEVTSRKTKKEDLTEKFAKYRDELKVSEYYLFDPTGDYLKKHRLRGYRLRTGDYVPIDEIDGRLASKVLGLHLEGVGHDLRFWDPGTKSFLPTPGEKLAKLEADCKKAEADRVRTERENDQLRRQLEALKQQAKRDHS